MSIRDYVGEEWFDILPHVIDDLVIGAFEMRRGKHSTIDKPTYEESHWKGSEHTAAMVAAQIAERYGEDEAARYNPETNCFTFTTWLAKGFAVRKGERGLLSSTIVKATDKEGNETGSYPKKVWLFFDRQVDPIKEKL